MFKRVGIHRTYDKKYVASYTMDVASNTFRTAPLPHPPKGYAKFIVKCENVEDATSVTFTMKYRMTYEGLGSGEWKSISGTKNADGTLYEVDLYKRSDWGQGIFTSIDVELTFSASKKMKVEGNYYYE